MTEMTTVDRKLNSVGDLLRRQKPMLEQMIPSHLGVDRMIRAAMTCLSGGDKLASKLRECSDMSLYRAISQATTLGLEIDTPLGQAYLIPYAKVATFQPGYRGLVELAMRSGKVEKVWSRVVRTDDEFEFTMGTEEWIKHRPKDNPPDDVSKFRCVYACAKMRDGGVVFTLLWPNEIKRRMTLNPNSGKSTSPWKIWPEPMWRKCALTTLCTQSLPLSPELQRAAGVANTEHLGDKAPNVIEVPYQEVAQEALEEGESKSVVKGGGKPAKTAKQRGRAAAQAPQDAPGSSGPAGGADEVNGKLDAASGWGDGI